MKFTNFLKDDKEESLPALLMTSLFIITSIYFLYTAIFNPDSLSIELLWKLYLLSAVGGGGDKLIKSKNFPNFNKK